MARRRRGGLPSDLVRGRERFRAWRRARTVRTRIPERLWSLAVKLADSHGVSRTSSVLGLDYYGLKRRLQSSKAAAPTFIELPPPPVAGSGECVVEFEDSAGASMRIHLKGYEAPDLAALSHGFWNAD